MINQGQSDQYLIERYKSGDRSTLPVLVKRWHKTFCQKAFWILKDKEKSKDVAQECWMIIIQKLPSLKNTDSFKSWALKIVYNKAIDTYKNHARELQHINNIKNGVGDQIEDENKHVILRVRLLKAIQNLSKNKQDILRLFYLEEYSLKEISAFLDIPVGTVKSRLFTAREELKSIIKS